MPFEPISRVQQIGNMLGGFGAGLQGQGPQFQQQQMQQQQMQQQQMLAEKAQVQAQQAQKQEMLQAREQAVYTDAAASLELAEMGDWDSVVQLGVNRLESMQQLGVEDPSGTQRLTQLALAARNGSEEAAELFKDEIQSTVNLGRATGAIDRTEPRKLNLVQQLTAGGGTKTLNTDDYGNFWDMAGNQVELAAEDRIVESATITGTPDQYGLNDKQAGELDNKEIATRNMIDMTVDAIELIKAEPNLNTLTARASSAVNNLQQEFTAIARSWTGEEFDSSLLDPDNPEYQAVFDEMGIENSRMRSLVTSMAYARAAAREQGGRFSDNDIKASMAELSVSADPRAFTQVLRDVASRTAREFSTTFEVLTDTEFDGDFGLDRLGSAEADTIQGYIDSGMTPEDAAELYGLENP